MSDQERRAVHAKLAAFGDQSTDRRYGQALPGFSNAYGSLFTPQRPIAPEYEDQTRNGMPRNRKRMNRLARMYYQDDPVVGAVVDMLSELGWCNFELTGPGIEGEVRQVFEDCLDQIQLRANLPYLNREWLVVGEVAPHLQYDDDLGYWSNLTFLDPDHLSVLYSPVLRMEPIVQWIPDEMIKKICTVDHPLVRAVRETIPDVILDAVISGQNIPLNPASFTFIPRRTHPYYIRGTTLFTRLWRTFIYEDAVWSASVATARRQAAPLKLVKHGDPATNWVPDPGQEEKFMRQIAQQELDPMAWISWHYAVNIELVGIQERVLPLTQHYPLIESIKLAALGVSKGFLTGETSYSSAAAGLTVLLQNLKSRREFFESVFLYPKLLLGLSKLNDFVQPTQAEVSHRIRVRRSAREVSRDRRWIVPQIQWERSLDPSVDMERLNAINLIKQMGFPVSGRTTHAAAGLSYAEETKQVVDEVDQQRALVANDPGRARALGVGPDGAPAGGEGGGAGGLALAPGLPAGTFGDMGPPPEEALPSPTPPPEEGGASAAPGGGAEPTGAARVTLWDADQLNAGARLFESFDARDALAVEPWDRIVQDSDVLRALRVQDPEGLWLATETWLVEQGYPARAIMTLQDSLRRQGRLGAMDSKLQEVLGMLEKTNVQENLSLPWVAQTRKRNGTLNYYEGAPQNRRR